MKSIYNHIHYVFLIYLFCIFSVPLFALPKTISLNGTWDCGLNRSYNRNVTVPSIPLDATQMTEGKLWYKKEIKLPKGDWEYATLILKGARFSPEVYVDGTLISSKNGGMAQTSHLLKGNSIKPGNTIVLEIALKSLKDIPITDASYIPIADQWRSNISSCLWDDVLLEFHGEARISRIIPFTNIEDSTLIVKYETDIYKNKKKKYRAECQIFDSGNNILASGQSNNNEIKLSISKCKLWTPQTPHLYKLKIKLYDEEHLISTKEINYAPRKFCVQDKQFYLNNKPCKIRGGSIVWHRWVRNEEGQQLAWDTIWFKKNVIMRLKEHGANLLRFHLGNPPKRILELCDRYGLLVQYEWSFFHGMPASEKSLIEQLKPWLDEAMEHPSVAIIHPYNETEGEKQIKTMWNALNRLIPDYPPLVLEDRETIHIHKYWWSLFENLGLYYDSYDQFPKAIMVDEFGGNYLDGKGNFGGYPTIPESYMRFLGKENTREMRLQHLSESNAKVAEYWRRIGAAGFSPFVILSSWEDGNHWFLNDLKDGEPKPVWNALTAAYSPRSISIDLWDRNFLPSQKIKLPIYLFNDESFVGKMNVRLRIKNKNNKIFFEKIIMWNAKPYSRDIHYENVNMPSDCGDYIIEAELLNKPESVMYPVISTWNFRVFTPSAPNSLKEIKIGVSSKDKELQTFLSETGIKSTDLFSKDADILLTSQNVWEQIEKNDTVLKNLFEESISKGKSVILLDVGLKCLGQGYPKDKNELGPLQGVAVVENKPTFWTDLFGGIKLGFKEVAEPESHIQINLDKYSDLGFNFDVSQGWLWNGLRGGLIVPAADMEFEGLNQQSFISQWVSRGADKKKIKSSSYYAYELQGYYAFSTLDNDLKTQNQLREKVRFLVDDAPALSVSINPNAPIQITNIALGYQKASNGIAENQYVLASAGKNLTRSPLVEINFGSNKGKLIISQLLTAGRLSKESLGKAGQYDIRYDPSAVQLVLNLISRTVKHIN